MFAINASRQMVGTFTNKEAKVSQSICVSEGKHIDDIFKALHLMGK
jgi:hypothetical protein